jgi:stage II sporulation protein P
LENPKIQSIVRRKVSRTMKKISKVLICLTILTVLFAPTASADDWYETDRGYYTLMDQNGNELTMMARQIYVGDEYISGSNKHYRVTKVDKKGRRAYAKLLGEISLPEFDDLEAAVSVAQKDNPGTIVLYATHNSESYVPSDGKESIQGNGGILDVADAFRKNLKEKGINAVLDKSHHDPHDAGSYRRSRQTAINLIKNNMPVAAKFDIHRDATPKKTYDSQVNGENVTKVRIVIGRRNQNRKANEELAYKIKSIADKAYPGLIKDIFLGRGTYNQELSPRSLLLEFGTHESNKEDAIKSTAYLADTIQKAMFGGAVQKKDNKGDAEGPKTRVKPISQESKTGGRSGIIWIVLLVIGGAVGFLLISSGGREMFSKASKFTREEFSSFLGRKKKKK